MPTSKSFTPTFKRPVYAPWGHERVTVSRELKRRIKPVALDDQVVVVLGACGALGPGVVHAVKLLGFKQVIGVDRMLTYEVDGVDYHGLDLSDVTAIDEYFPKLFQWLKHRNLRLTTVIDLCTVQTNPRSGDKNHREDLLAGQNRIFHYLTQLNYDVKYVFMSTAEVYGVPEGAPFKEDHVKQPFNPYGKAKWMEEQNVLKWNGAATINGKIYTTALRSWTIAMVTEDEAGKIVSCRTYNDPMVFLVYKLACLRIPIPLSDPQIRTQFHLEEDIEESLAVMSQQNTDSPIWGKAFNAIGQAASHGSLRDVCVAMFDQFPMRKSIWTWLLMPIAGKTISPALIEGLSRIMQFLGNQFGLREVGSRLPFLYRSLDIDSSAIRRAIGDQLFHARGGRTEEAVQRMITGLIRGGDMAINVKRYGKY